MDAYRHIIISRTDNIGDVVLTLPLALLLKQKWKNCRITFLARNYVKEVVQACPYIDDFLSMESLTIEQLRALNADAIIHVFPNKLIAGYAKKAGIPYRIGTSHRWYHWFTCNRRIDFTRKNSTLHEAQLNLALLAAFNMPTFLPLDEIKQMPLLKKKSIISDKIKSLLDHQKFNLIIHPLTNGNTKEWPLDYFIALINMLDHTKFNIIVTGTEPEKIRLLPLINQCSEITNTIGQLNLAEFVELISHAEGLLANSTGPLHIAAAFNIHALGLFPPDKGKDPARWQPIGSHSNYLIADNTDIDCMKTITPANVKKVIELWA